MALLFLHDGVCAETPNQQTKPTKAAGKVRTSGWLRQPKEEVKQCETRGNEFILCAQYVIIRSMAAFLPREVESLPLGLRDLLHSSYGELWSRHTLLQKGASLHRQRYCKTKVAGLHGRQSKAIRKTAILLTKVTENGADHARHFRLKENSRISNR